ncbi:phospholipid carrier-dependent glycosyltransferase [Candidatus Microgenomates bacterium]|nr:MAG: phospholipid carrier-dependent glycosyltransferase [Candidatus Microgenomates bacterium]
MFLGMLMCMKINKPLLIVVILAFLVRVISINDAPPSLNWDEVSHAYNAYSIVTTGADEWGVPYPTIFRAYGDYKLPVYIYVTAISVKLFGLNDISVRLPSIFSGVALVYSSYLLALYLFKKKKIAYFTAVLVAVSPWSLFVSRAAFEANMAISLTVAGVCLAFRGLERKKGSFALAALLFGLSVWTYNSARIFSPVILLSFVVMYFGQIKILYSKNRKEIWISAGVLILFFLPMFAQLLGSSGQARYQKLAIINEGSVSEVVAKRQESELHPVASRLMYNKYTFFVQNFLANYISYFDPEFLFLNGGDHYQFSVPGAGLLFFVYTPFFYYGLFYVFRRARKDKHMLFVGMWTLVYPVAGSIVTGAPHVLRGLTFLPIPMIMISVGIAGALRIITNKHRKYAEALVYVSIALCAIGYLNTYFTSYAKEYSWAWQYGYSEALSFVKDNYDNYDKIIITKKYGEPHEFLLYQFKWNSHKYSSDLNLVRFYQSEWYWVDRFDKFYFMNDWEVPDRSDDKWTLESKQNIDIKGKILLVASPENYPKDWSIIKKVDFASGEPAFVILTNQND